MNDDLAKVLSDAGWVEPTVHETKVVHITVGDRQFKVDLVHRNWAPFPVHEQAPSEAVWVAEVYDHGLMIVSAGLTEEEALNHTRENIQNYLTWGMIRGKVADTPEQK